MKMPRAIVLIGTLLVLSLVTIPARAATAPVMVGYFPAFKGLDRIATTPIGHYTHIALAFANPDAEGVLLGHGAMTCMSGGADGAVTLTALRETVKRLSARGAKVLLSVGGGTIPGCSGDWAALLRSAGGREKLRDALMAVIDGAPFDGLDIDIEGALLTEIDRQGSYTPFIALLAKSLKARGKLLTVATGSYEGGMIPVSSVRYFDLVMPMSYDAIGPSWGAPGSEHSTYAQAERDIALWLARGVKPERLVLGVPFYGYGFGSYAPGGGFNTIFAAHGQAALSGDLIGRACGRCDYITFNSPATLQRKAELARSRAGGVMVWEITQDTPDQLLAATISGVLRAPGAVSN
jgi:GH18 family chitinase